MAQPIEPIFQPVGILPPFFPYFIVQPVENGSLMFLLQFNRLNLKLDHFCFIVPVELKVLSVEDILLMFLFTFDWLNLQVQPVDSGKYSAPLLSIIFVLSSRLFRSP